MDVCLARVVILVRLELCPSFSLHALFLCVFSALLLAGETAVHGKSEVDYKYTQHGA